jgi:uncharacterized protein
MHLYLHRRGVVLAALAGGLLLAAEITPAQTGAAAPRPGSLRTLTWEDLIPKGWDPMAVFQNRPPGPIVEGSPREIEMMKELRRIWDEAPTRKELDGAGVRLPGYVVPLEQANGEVSEFLLVPYFGACIHSPPPPANQIVHVRLAKPRALRTMDVVWAGGRMATQRRDSPMGSSGYTLNGAAVEFYREERK